MNKTLEWVLSAELPGGGISAWQLPNGSSYGPYIEITGYILPTLINWDAGDIVLRCADWLLRSQNPDGSFYGLDGVPRPFDTSAVIEGLEAVYQATGTTLYRAGANRATDWMRTQITAEGTLKNSPTNPEANLYLLRASAIIGNYAELEYWKLHGLIHIRERAHLPDLCPVRGCSTWATRPRPCPTWSWHTSPGTCCSPTTWITTGARFYDQLW